MSIARLGGFAALVCAATYIFGFTFLLTALSGSGLADGDVEAGRMVAYLADNAAMTRLWYFVIYVVNAVFLAVLTVALAERIGAHSGAAGRLVLSFGLIWATLVLGAGMAMSVGIPRVVALYGTDPKEALGLWRIAEMIEAALGGGNEIAGGVWALAIGFAVLSTGAMGRAFAVVSIAIGAAGLLTVLPPLAEIAGSAFGLGYIAWFVWAGVVLLRA
jgi:hypothetical protein